MAKKKAPPSVAEYLRQNSEVMEFFREQGAKGGKIAAKKMSPAARKARAKKAADAAAKARTSKKKPAK